LKRGPGVFRKVGAEKYFLGDHLFSPPLTASGIKNQLGSTSKVVAESLPGIENIAYV
jgi:hypothetical protein